jgi:hypothetical protein
VKHIVYKYDDGQPDEMDFDGRGLFNFAKGDIVSKHGATWSIDTVERIGENDQNQIPTVRIYLKRVVGR